MLTASIGAAPLLWLGVALVLATLSGEFIWHRFGWPRVAGYLAAGLLIAFGGGGLPATQPPSWASMLIDGGVGLLLFEAGARVRAGWLLRNRSLLASALLGWSLAALACWGVIRVGGGDSDQAWPLALALASGAPTVVLRLGAELGARGQVSERLLLLSVFGALLSIVGVGIAQLGLRLRASPAEVDAWLLAGWSLLGAVAVGVALAVAVDWVERHVTSSDSGAMLLLVGILLLALGTARALHCSALLAALLGGLLLRRSPRRIGRWPQHFGSVGGLMLVLLMLVLGLRLGGGWSLGATQLGVALVLVRGLAHLLGQLVLGPASGLSLRQSAALGLSLNLMSPVGFALLVDAGAISVSLRGALVALALLGLGGPALTRWSLRWSGDIAGEAR